MWSPAIGRNHAAQICPPPHRRTPRPVPRPPGRPHRVAPTERARPVPAGQASPALSLQHRLDHRLRPFRAAQAQPERAVIRREGEFEGEEGAAVALGHDHGQEAARQVRVGVEAQRVAIGQFADLPRRAEAIGGQPRAALAQRLARECTGDSGDARRQFVGTIITAPSLSLSSSPVSTARSVAVTGDHGRRLRVEARFKSRGWPMAELTIGEVARRAGLNASALRWYERVGLLPAPRRVAGRRRYEPSVLHRLAAIRLAQEARLHARGDSRACSQASIQVPRQRQPGTASPRASAPRSSK